MKKSKQEFINKKFENCMIIEYVEYKDYNHFVKIVCNCGEVISNRKRYSDINNKTRCIKCRFKYSLDEDKKRLNSIYKNMVTRCYNPKFKQFKNFKDNWFVFGDMEPITVHKMNYQNEKNAENAGVKRINLHGFRHSCASMLINNNVNISVVSNYLGHADIEETLNTYTHMFDSAVNSVIDIINKIDEKQSSSSNEVIDTITNLCNNGVSIDEILKQLKNIKN